MKKIALVVLIFTVFTTNAQHTISGTFSPAEDYKWLIVYELKPGTQNYVADTKIQDGKFTLVIPEDSSTGTYRLVYAVPQEEFYFDVIYNGKEDIELAFDAEEGVSFISSEENTLLNSYFREVNKIEQQIIGFYTSQNTDQREFLRLVDQLKSVQDAYEEKSKGLIAAHFIKANDPYIPIGFEPVKEYVKNKKESYFNSLDFNDPVLQASGFLTDKTINYVLTALPLEQTSRAETEKIMQENVRTVDRHLGEVADNYKFHLFYTLWTQSDVSGFNNVSDFIYDTYLKSLAVATNNQNIIDEIDVHNRLRIGSIAPEIVWKDGEVIKRLSSLYGAKNYVLVFWSSTCSHCLNELPKLHEKSKEKTDVKVVAVGLEDDDTSWKRESAKLPNFEHAISLGKWESEYANLYAIDQTPTYFVIDSDKKIIAKPRDYEGVLEFLKGTE